jgi:hypothetical protein
MELFYKDPLEQILAEINTKNAATLKRDLTAADVLFTQVSSNDDTGVREIIVKAKPGADYYGSVKNPGVTYKRYVGDKLFVVTPRIWGQSGETYDVLVQRMAELYNLPPFTIEPAEGDTVNPYDFAKDLRTRVADDGGDGTWQSFTMQIQFRDDSIGYVGIFPIVVYNADRDLGKIIKNTALDGLTYPDDTGGTTGSLSTLTYPIEFDLPSISKEVLGVVGSSLSTDVSDATVKAIVDQILSYYEAGNIASFERADLESVIAGATVTESNLLGEGGVENTSNVVIVLSAVAAENAKFVGHLYIRDPSFEGGSGN